MRKLFWITNISLDVIIGCSLSFLVIRNMNGSKSEERREIQAS